MDTHEHLQIGINQRKKQTQLYPGLQEAQKVVKVNLLER
jgi:hypothetical protein